MNTKFLLVLGWVGVLFSSTCFAEYLPLLGSQFAQDHPGVLPYSDCRILSGSFYDPKIQDGGTTSSSGGGFLVGGSSVDQTVYLSCVSEKHGVAFQIPIYLGKIFSVPEIGFHVASDALLIQFNSETLDSHTVADVLGRYHAYGFQLEYALGNYTVSQYSHWTDEKPKVSLFVKTKHSHGGGLGLGGLYSTLSLSMSSMLENSNRREGKELDPYVLFSSTRARGLVSQPSLVRVKTPQGDRYAIRLQSGGYAVASSDGSRINRFFFMKDLNSPLGDTIKDDFVAVDGTWGFWIRDGIAYSVNHNEAVYQTLDREVVFRTEDPLDSTALAQLQFVRDPVPAETHAAPMP